MIPCLWIGWFMTLHVVHFIFSFNNIYTYFCQSFVIFCRILRIFQNQLQALNVLKESSSTLTHPIIQIKLHSLLTTLPLKKVMRTNHNQRVLVKFFLVSWDCTSSLNVWEIKRCYRSTCVNYPYCCNRWRIYMKLNTKKCHDWEDQFLTRKKLPTQIWKSLVLTSDSQCALADADIRQIVTVKCKIVLANGANRSESFCCFFLFIILLCCDFYDYFY